MSTLTHSARRSPSSDVKGSHVLLISSKRSDWLLLHIKALHESRTILTGFVFVLINGILHSHAAV